MTTSKVRLLLFIYILFSLKLAHGVTVNEYLNGSSIQVPKGNVGQSVKKETTLSKYKDILKQLTKENYGCVIRQASEIYGIDPVAIMGSIIGEHTYNVDNWDYWGEQYLYMRKKWISRFSDNGLDLNDLINEKEYKGCEQLTNNNYDLWTCYNSIWKTDQRNSRRNNKFWEIKWTFFNPLGSGYTYGLGQLGPERALMVTDLVSEKSGFELLSLSNPTTIYDHILNPQVSIHYVAASNLRAIEIYKNVANFDISKNMGVIATLYNLGREMEKAEEKYQETVRLLQNNEDLVLPMSNYYGWFINEKEDEIRAAYKEKVENLSPAICKKHTL